MLASGTHCVWITGSNDEVCRAEFWPFFLRCGSKLGMVTREYAMSHEQLLNFIGGYCLDDEAQKFYDWLGDWIRLRLEPLSPAISSV